MDRKTRIAIEDNVSEGWERGGGERESERRRRRR